MTLPDVGGWFRTASDQPGLKIRGWGTTGEGFGRVSPTADVDAAWASFKGRPTMVLTGAGMSTASGLPDYRGRDAVPRAPMTYDEFMLSDLSRRRYWARSTVGWASFRAARPNDCHRLLAQLEQLTPITGVVTQNVDQLHQAAGSTRVLDLHGALASVVCQACEHRIDRDDFQIDLLALNPQVAPRITELAEQTRTLPDGDAEVDRTEDFHYPDCPQCHGILKPDVVFFGESARREVVDQAFAWLDASEAILVLGSSLTVMSGLRFVRRAAKDGKTVVIVNDGTTRGDELATHRVHGRLAGVLGRWCGA